MALFSNTQLESIRQAISSEIAVGKKQAKPLWLDIDAIKFVRQVPNGYVYNLLLSKPTHLSAEQPLQFQLKGAITVEAVVLSSSDEGIVVICSQPLPENAVVMNVTFDPSFILVHLGNFIEALASQTCPLAEKLMQKKLEQGKKCDPSSMPADFNADQRRAIVQMEADEIHLLWGPPGTGKTTTLGAAIAKWIEQQQTVLIVSTSNAAVDVAMESAMKRLKGKPNLIQRLLRLGKSDNPHVSPLTKGNLNTAYAVGCTVAKMVIDPDLKLKKFDVVVVDESSMVSLLYAVAAATFAKDRLVYGGDFMQLPPICQSGGAEAEQWLGRNVYDWLGIGFDSNPETLPMTMLRTQYRMTSQIGDLVSHLCYKNRLVHGRNSKGAPVEFVDVPKQWRETFYSVAESSYYHPFSIPIIHNLVEALASGEKKEFLLLTPFRPQQSLLGALAFDLRDRYEGHRFASSTIHRSQGGERRVIILDLTAHSSTKLARFFQDKHAERLLNVGMSRARDHLVIIGNQEMIWALAQKNVFWKRLLDKWDGISVYGAGEILDEPHSFESLHSLLNHESEKGIPSICSYRPGSIPLSRWDALLTAVESPRKLMILPKKERVSGAFIVRDDTDSPPLFVGQGYVCLPLEAGWTVNKSPNVGRVIWRVGFSHLAEEEVRPAGAEKVFQCPKCTPGKLVLRSTGGELRLACNNTLFRCFYNRLLTLREATMKVRLAGVTCCQQHRHPMTARESGHGFFMSCENWPDCECPPKPLKLIENM